MLARKNPTVAIATEAHEAGVRVSRTMTVKRRDPMIAIHARRQRVLYIPMPTIPQNGRKKILNHPSCLGDDVKKHFEERVRKA